MGRNVCNWLQVVAITLSYGLGGVKSICGVLWKPVGYRSFLEMVVCVEVHSPQHLLEGQLGKMQTIQDGFWSAARIT